MEPLKDYFTRDRNRRRAAWRRDAQRTREDFSGLVAKLKEAGRNELRAWTESVDGVPAAYIMIPALIGSGVTVALLYGYANSQPENRLWLGGAASSALITANISNLAAYERARMKSYLSRQI